MDKLAAIEGVGCEIARLTRQNYEMGVFTQNMVRELA
jgi:hypothetical protein